MAQGETIRIRFMNEGVMGHPWHLHGMPMRVVSRDEVAGLDPALARRWGTASVAIAVGWLCRDGEGVTTLL